MRLPDAGLDFCVGRRSASDPTTPGDDGFILIPVLAALFLLALGAVLLAKSVALDIRLTAISERRAVGEELANGLTRLVLHHLTVNAPVSGKSGQFRLDGIPQHCRVGSLLVSIQIVDVDGQININYSTLGLLQAAVRGVGLADSEAQLMAENIVDFRSPGDFSISGGSKSSRYQSAGLYHGPKNEPFGSVAELDQVAGMTPALLQRLKLITTVHSRFGTVNPAVASLPVLQALAGAEAGSLERSTPEELDDLRAKVVIPTEYTYITRTRSVRTTVSNTYQVTVAVYLQSNVRFGRQAVVDLSGGTGTGPEVRQWIEVEPPASVSQAEVQPCIGGLLLLNKP